MGVNKGKSISIFSSKGGTGKTMTALNIAGVFSRLNKKVLIIDFDLTSGAINTYLNGKAEKTIANIADDYLAHAFMDIKDYVTKYSENISFLASPLDPRIGTSINSGIINVILEKASFDFDYIICDMNHNISEFNLTVLDNTDLNLLILTNDLIDIKNMGNLVRIFKDAEKDNYKILLNESVNPYKKYFGLFDIKNIIKANIDYCITSSFFIKTIDNYIADGKIITLEEKMPKYYPAVLKTFTSICNDLMEVEDEK